MPDYDPVQKAALDPAVLEDARTDALKAFAAAANLEALIAERTAHLGDRSPVALANREIGVLPPQARKDAGQLVGRIKRDLDEALRRSSGRARGRARRARAGRGDGRRHPAVGPHRARCTGTRSRWSRRRSPTSSSRWATRSPRDRWSRPSGTTSTRSTWVRTTRPARCRTRIFLDPPSAGVVMRTHTSPVQIRALLERGAPCYVVAPGKVVRNDPIDATHSPVFHQLECLAVDEGLTMAHLRGTIDTLAQAVFGKGLTLAAATVVLPVHRAVRRGRPGLLRLRRRRGGLPHLRGRGLDRVGRLRHGSPPRPARRRGRPRPLQRLRLRHGAGPAADVPARHRRLCGTSSKVTSGSPRRSGWRSDVRVPMSWLRELVDPSTHLPVRWRRR